MAEERVQRRLAAILAADVVGYSRLMQQDEAGTLAALKARRRQILEPLVALHQGRVFKVAGDGVLVEFASAVNAVQCAIELQQGMAGANETQSGDRQIVLRIGVNLGDVLVEGNDLYGDGVNIAARLETNAEPGGILVSGTAHDHVRNKVKASFEDLGVQAMKNIAEPVRAYRVRDTPFVPAAAVAALVADKPSIAVLPFNNMSGDPEQEYFSDGITEDIITELARFHSLFVIARNSSFQYRGKNVDVRRVGRELGVRYVVEGSIRKAENRIRLTAQLLDADTGAHLWADRYDRALDDLFLIQDELVQAIVSAIPRMVGEAIMARSRRRPIGDLTAYDCVLRGEWHVAHGDTTGNPEARAMFERALELDPDCARAHANLGYQFAYDLLRLGTLSPQGLQRARDHIERALQLDSGDSSAHEIAAFIYLLAQEYDLADHHADKGVQANANDRHALSMRGLVTTCLGDPARGIDWIHKARRLDPKTLEAGREPMIEAYYASRQYARGIELLRQWPNPPPHMIVDAAAFYAQVGQFEDARRMLQRFESVRPGSFDIQEYMQVHTRLYKRQADRDHWLEGYRKAGLPV